MDPRQHHGQYRRQCIGLDRLPAGARHFERDLELMPAVAILGSKDITITGSMLADVFFGDRHCRRIIFWATSRHTP